MYFLIFKEDYAKQNNRLEDSEICYEAQKKFVKEHLGTWVPFFTKLLAEKAGRGFYKALALLTKSFLRSEIEFFKVNPEEIKELGTMGRGGEGMGISSPCDEV